MLIPEVWGKGGGSLLMAEGLWLLVGAGYTSTTLWVLTTNSRARQFYEARGWAEDGADRIDERWGFPLEEIRYTHSL